MTSAHYIGILVGCLLAIWVIHLFGEHIGHRRH